MLCFYHFKSKKKKISVRQGCIEKRNNVLITRKLFELIAQKKKVYILLSNINLFLIQDKISLGKKERKRKLHLQIARNILSLCFRSKAALLTYQGLANLSQVLNS